MHISEAEMMDMEIGEILDYVNCFFVYDGRAKLDTNLTDEDMIPDLE
jgi:hypothetical protein